jgi:hypothetical protein
MAIDDRHDFRAGPAIAPRNELELEPRSQTKTVDDGAFGGLAIWRAKYSGGLDCSNMGTDGVTTSRNTPRSGRLRTHLLHR